MHKIEHLNFDNIHLSEPKPSFQTDVPVPMRFISVRYPTRQLLLYLHGTVAEGPNQAPAEYGSGWSFYFKPNMSDLPAIAELEELLQPGSTQHKRLIEELDYPQLNEHFELRETLNEAHNLRIKLKTDENGWKFTCNAAMTLDSMEMDLKKGTRVTLTVAPGFYFSEESQRYGLYLTLKDLIFDEAAEMPMRKKLDKGKKILKK